MNVTETRITLQERQINDSVTRSDFYNNSGGIYDSYALYNAIAYHLSITITALIITLNAVVIWIIGRRKKITRLYCHLLNLAIADLGAGLLDVLPTTLERANDFNFYITDVSFANTVCKLQRGIGHTTMVASNYILAVMSIDRAEVVIRPMSSFKRGRIVQWLSAMICWIIGIAASIPVAILNRIVHSVYGDGCEINFETDPDYWWKVYFTVKLVVVFLIPLFIIVVSYTSLLIGIYRRGLTPPGSTDTTASHTFNRRLPRSKIISLKLTFGIILSFVVCWTPHFVIGALQVYASADIPPVTIFMVLYYLNSVANPILFFLFHYKKQENAANRTPTSDIHLSLLSSLRQKLALNSTSSGSSLSLNGHSLARNENGQRKYALLKPGKVVFQ